MIVCFYKKFQPLDKLIKFLFCAPCYLIYQVQEKNLVAFVGFGLFKIFEVKQSEQFNL